jgi:hypothetical protein
MQEPISTVGDAWILQEICRLAPDEALQQRINSTVETHELDPFMQLIEQQTPPDSVLLTPLEDDYRLGARRAVYVDWKSHPYLGAEVLEWWQRVEFVRQFYTLDATARQQACQTAGVDYYVVQAAAHSEPEPVVISWEEWRLVPCPLP